MSNNILLAMVRATGYASVDLILGWAVYIFTSRLFNLDENRKALDICSGLYMIRSMVLCYLFMRHDYGNVSFIFLINLPFGLYNLFSPKANTKSLKREIKVTYIYNVLVLLLIGIVVVYDLFF